MHHPWRLLRSLSSWTVVWDKPASGSLAECHWESRTITITPGLSQAQRRSALAHELVHVERGPSLAWMTPREERFVSAESARRLIEIHALGEALAWAHTLDEAADELWVDLATLRARLDHLHPSERHYLIRRLEHDDHTR